MEEKKYLSEKNRLQNFDSQDIIKIRTLHRLVHGSDFCCLVHLKGLEPSRRGHQILSLARLPIPPQVRGLLKPFSITVVLLNLLVL